MKKQYHEAALIQPNTSLRKVYRSEPPYVYILSPGNPQALEAEAIAQVLLKLSSCPQVL